MAGPLYRPLNPTLPFGKRGSDAFLVPCDTASAQRWAATLPGARVRVNQGLACGMDLYPVLAAGGVPVPNLAQACAGVQTPGLAWYQGQYLPRARVHQPAMSEFLALRSYALNSDPMRCLSGDTEVLVNRGGGARRMLLRDLVAKLHGATSRGGKRWDLSIPTLTQSMDAEGFIRLNQVVTAHALGKKPLFQLVAGGQTIKATAEHVFLCLDGIERSLSALRPGEQILRIEYPQRGRVTLKKRKTYLDQNAMWNHPYACKFVTKKGERVARVPKHRVAKEAELSGLTLAGFVARVRRGDTQDLKFLDPAVWAVHHRNESTHDNRAENLEVAAHAEHWREHGQNGGWKHVTARAVPVVIDSIEAVPAEDTFDLTLAAPHHNYVANGFVAHNSGKTLSAIAAAQLIAARQVLVVCPAIVKLVWAREIAQWTGEPALILDGRSGTESRLFCVTCMGTSTVTVAGSLERCPDCRARNGSAYGYKLATGEGEAKAALKDARWILCNYDLLIPQTEFDDAGKRYIRDDLAGWAGLLAELRLDVIIADEAHLLRGRTERARKALSRRDRLKLVAKRVPRLWALTGTPIYGMTRDLYGLLDVLNPWGWGTGHEFDLRYAGAVHNGYGWEAKGQTNVGELQARLGTFMLKRTRAEISPGMAPKHRHVHYLEAEAGDLRAAKRVPGEKGQGGLHAALRVTARIKQRAAVEAALDGMAEGERVVIFTYLRSGVEEVAEALREKLKPKSKTRDTRINPEAAQVWAVGDASVPSYKLRDSIATAFRAHTGPGVLIATMDSMPVGISLAGAAQVLFADLHIEPATLLQAEDRALVHGIGGLNVTYFCVKGTVDEHVLSILLPKMEQIEVAMNDSEAGAFRAAFTPTVVADEVWERMMRAAELATG